MRRCTKHALTSFGKAFGMTILVMGVILAIICISFYSHSRTTEDKKETLPLVYLPRSEDRLSVLIAGVENRHTPPDVYLLLGFLPHQGRVALCLLPPVTYLEYGGERTTLERLYSHGGTKYARQALAEYLGIPLERWATVEVEKLTQMMALTGLMDYYLPIDLSAQLHGRRIEMPRGNYQLDGRKAADILAYPSYRAGELERSDRGAILLSQLIGQNLCAFLTDSGDTVMGAFLDRVETDLSWKDYEERKAAAAFLARLELPATSVVYIEGNFNQDGSEFYLTPDCVARIREIYADVPIQGTFATQDESSAI